MPAPQKNKADALQMLDLPLLVAASLTVGFYLFVTQPAMEKTLLHRYTTEHCVEYVVVAFFIWGITDVVFRALAFPREMLALRQDWLPARTAKEPVSHAGALYASLQKKPQWLLDSRIGKRLTQALAHLQEKGSADEFSDYLRDLADIDDERTYTNYGLVRFIAWVTPVLGFLGTVIHFGTALSGFSANEMAEKLPIVVGEMATAFNTTTVALAAATSMMFCLFICERTERGIVHGVDRRTERELLNRFEVTDASLAPFLNALQAASQANLRAMDVTIERQLTIWGNALQTLQQEAEGRLQWLGQIWEEASDKLQQRSDASETEHAKRFQGLLDSMERHQKEHRVQVQVTADQVSELQEDLAGLVTALTTMVRDEGTLVELQSTLSENLRVLRETQQLDQCLHGLTAAIHLLTARHQPAAIKESRAA